MPQKPVIFLAFANDRVDHTAYLRNLPIELDGIRSALQKAVKAGLCEVVERSNATIQHILDVFQDEYYKDRIAIFHYGGHANGYQLLLENLDGSHASAHADGLVSFFSKQQGLQLIFLNGCSSQQQALDLIGAGVAAVIGTSQSINDDVATQLAIRFYKGMAAGKAIDRSWQEAIDEVKITKGTANMRDLFWDGMEESTFSSSPAVETQNLASPQPLSHLDRFPWEIHYKEGAEIIKEWNLPEAVDNPLFGLPTTPNTDLPEVPYRFLERYKREHAEIFFGRSYFIRELFNRATDPNAAPIILFYGQSGVGKSSMLDAGLFPRLEQVCNVIYLRRDAQKGLLGTMAEGLGTKVLEYQQNKTQTAYEQVAAELQQLTALAQAAQGEKLAAYQALIATAQQQLELLQRANQENKFTQESAKSLSEVWQEQEAQFGKPLVVLLDQVEEIYTKPNPENPHEIEQAMKEVYDLFGDPKNRPQGKLILSYRKEYHPEIEEAFKKLQLPRERVFLRKLERRDIQEVVKGLAITERLQRQYSLTVEKELNTIIADDLLEDKDSPIAPVLQILLTKMWKLSEQEELRYFSIKKYQQLKRQGILMDDFFHEQMQFVREYFPALEASGLALDVLHFHTTKLGTANSHSLEELRERYGARQQEVDRLIGEFKNLYLLADAGVQTTGLAHDTLAPIVQDEFRHSDKPGQRAALILQNKVIAYAQDSNTVLDLDDLRLVEEGANGMRIWTRKEEELIEKSRKRRAAILAERKRNKQMRRIGVTVIAFISVIASVLGVFSYFKSQEAQEQTMVANQQTEKANDALHQLTLKQDSLNVSLKDAEAARDTAEVQRIKAEKAENQAIIDQLIAQRESKRAREAESKAIEKRLQAEALVLASQSQDWFKQGNLTRALGLAVLAKQKGLESKGEVPYQVHQAMMEAYYFGFGKKKQRIAYQKVMRGHSQPVQRIIIAPNGHRMITVSLAFESGYGESILWDAQGNYLAKLLQPFAASMTNPGIIKLHFSPDGKRMIALAESHKDIIVMDDQGETLKQIHHDQGVSSLGFLPNSPNFYATLPPTYGDENTASMLIWNQEGTLLKRITDQANITQVFEVEQGKYIATASNKRLVIRDQRSYEPIRTVQYQTPLSYPHYFVFDEGRKLLAGGHNQAHQIYNLITGALELTAKEAPSSFIQLSDSTVYNNNTIWHFQDSIYKIISWQLPDYNYTDVSTKAGIIATASEGGMIQVRDLTGKLLQERASDGDRISQLKFTPDGKYFITVGREKLAMWDRNLNKVQDFKGHEGYVNAVEFTPNQKQLISCSQDQTAIIWDLDTQETTTKVIRHQTLNSEQSVYVSAPIQVSEDGRQFMSYDSYSAIIWDAKSLEKKLQIPEKQFGKDSPFEEGAIKAAYFSKDKTRIFLLIEQYTDRTIRVGKLYDAQGKLLKSFSDTPQIQAVSFSNQGEKIAIAYQKYYTAEEYGHIHLLDWNGNDEGILTEIFDDFNQMVFSPDDQYLITKFKQKVMVLNTTGEFVQFLSTHDQEIFPPTFTQEGEQLVIYSKDAIATIWETGTWKALGKITGRKYHGGDVNSFAASPDGTRILTGSRTAGSSKAFVLWDGLGNHLSSLKEIKEDAKGMSFSPDSQYFVAYWYNFLGLWTRNGEPIKLWTFKEGSSVSSATFMPDGQSIIVMMYNGEIKRLKTVQAVFAALSGNQRYQLAVDEKMALGLEINPSDVEQIKNPLAQLEVARSLVNQGELEAAKQLYKRLSATAKDPELVSGLLADYARNQWPLEIKQPLASTDEVVLLNYGNQLLNINRKEAALFFEKIVHLNPTVHSVWNLQKAYQKLAMKDSPSKFLPQFQFEDKQQLFELTALFFDYDRQIKAIETNGFNLNASDGKTLWEYGLHFANQLLARSDLQLEEKVWLWSWSGYLCTNMIATTTNLTQKTSWAEKALKFRKLVYQQDKKKQTQHAVMYALIELAKTRIYSKQFAASQQLLQQAYEIIPNYSLTNRVQAHLYTAQGAFEKAKPIYLKELEANKWYPTSFKRQVLADLLDFERAGISKSYTQMVKDLLELDSLE